MVWYDMNEWMVGQIGCVIWVALDGYTKNGSNEFPPYADGKVKSCCRNTIHLRPQNPTADKIKQEKVHSHTRPKNWTLQRSPLRPNILFPALSSNISLLQEQALTTASFAAQRPARNFDARSTQRAWSPSPSPSPALAAPSLLTQSTAPVDLHDTAPPP